MSGDRSGKQPRSSTIRRPESEVPSAFREVEFHRISRRTCQIFVGGGANALRTLDVRDLSEHQLLGDVYTRSGRAIVRARALPLHPLLA